MVELKGGVRCCLDFRPASILAICEVANTVQIDDVLSYPDIRIPSNSSW